MERETKKSSAKKDGKSDRLLPGRAQARGLLVYIRPAPTSTLLRGSAIDATLFSEDSPPPVNLTEEIGALTRELSSARWPFYLKTTSGGQGQDLPMARTCFL